MKKRVSILCILCMAVLLLPGCTKKEASSAESKMKQVSPNETGPEKQKKLPSGEKSSEPVDIDLTELSSTMVYAEVLNIMTSPEEYIGKTLRMAGPYYASYVEETKKYYHFVIINDATACCEQGIEFTWNGEHNYPDDYPADQTEVEMTGVFKSYEEAGKTYYALFTDAIASAE